MYCTAINNNRNEAVVLEVRVSSLSRHWKEGGRDECQSDENKQGCRSGCLPVHTEPPDCHFGTPSFRKYIRGGSLIVWLAVAGGACLLGNAVTDLTARRDRVVFRLVRCCEWGGLCMPLACCAATLGRCLETVSQTYGTVTVGNVTTQEMD